MRTIKRPAAHEPLVRLLAETNHPASGRSIFPTMRELLCFAATLGFSTGKRTPVGPQANEIDGRIFENSAQAMDLIYLIALADARSVEALQPDREESMLQAFEEYAASGLKLLDAWLKERPEDVYGDEAIFGALRKYGYLKGSGEAKPIDPADVNF